MFNKKLTKRVQELACDVEYEMGIRRRGEAHNGQSINNLWEQVHALRAYLDVELVEPSKQSIYFTKKKDMNANTTGPGHRQA